MANANIDWDEVLDWCDEIADPILWSPSIQALRADNYPAYEFLRNRVYGAMFERFGVTYDQLDDELERRWNS